MATLGLRLRRAEARQLARTADRAARTLPPGELAAVSATALS
jgi:hypothetical protein